MTLRAKAFVTTGVVLTILVFALYLSSQAILLHTFANLEERQARGNMRHALDELQETLSTLDSKASDWADWDDTYAFVVDHNRAFIRSNIQDATFTGLRLNLLLFLDSAGRMVYGKAFDLETQRGVPLPRGIEGYLTRRSPLVRRNPAKGSVTGAIVLPQGPMLIAARPILTSQKKGPVRGTLIMGRSLDEREIDRLRANTHLSLTLHQANDMHLPPDLQAARGDLLKGMSVAFRPLGSNEMAEYAVVHDVNGRVALFLRATEPRAIYAKGKMAVQYFIWLLFASGLVVCAVLVFGQERVVLTRLSLLSKDVTGIAATGDLSARVSEAGRDELSRLGSTINEMLKSLQSYQRERDEAQEALRRAHGELEARVLQRTAELAAANQGLQAEIIERHRAEDALRTSEQRFRALIENGSDVVTLLDTDGVILYYSPSIKRILGYSEEDLVGAEAFALVHPEDAERVRNTFAAILDAQETEVTLHYRFRHQDGSWRHLESRGRNGLGDPAVRAIVVNSRDITQRVQAEEELARLQQEFQQAQKMEVVGRLASGVAHDFNNALMPIMTYGHLLFERLDPADPLHRYAEQIVKTAERAASLPRQLLAFSRKQVLQPTVLNLDALIGDMAKMLRRLIGEDVLLTVTSSDVLGQVLADPGQIEQVITNLAVNARDAMPQGGTLTLETANADVDTASPRLRDGIPPGRYVILTASDTGCGMDRETQARIFEPFFTTKEAGRGTGLGLSTVYGIVTQSGGHIRVESEVGRGTTFRIYLPRVDDAEDATTEPEQEVATGGSEVILLGPYETGDPGTAGIDTLEQLAQVPGSFSGYLWTNKIELIGPAAKALK